MAKAGSAGVSVMRAELDAATSTSADAHEAQWRAGINRQLQPDAASHQLAASRAAAVKRTATALISAEKAAAERRRADRRNESKRARRAEAKQAEAAADVAAQVVAVLDDIIEQVQLDAVDDVEWEAFEDWLEAQGRDNASLDALCDWRIYVIYTAQNRPVLQYGMCTDCTRIIQSVAENTAGFP